MKFNLPRFFDIDHFKEANPHLAVTIVCDKDGIASEVHAVTKIRRPDKTEYCMACTATIKNRSAGERMGWTIFRSSKDSALCPACTRAREAKLAAADRFR